MLTPKSDHDSQLVVRRFRVAALVILALLLSGLLAYRATADQLARLPGVGPALADRIVAHRERRAAASGGEPVFQTETDLLAVRGVGPRKMRILRRYVEFATGEADDVTRGGRD